MMKKNGFTLAEVLITLGIIGVVAALTAPALVQNTGSAQIGPKLAKAVSTFELANQNLLNEANMDTLNAAGAFNGEYNANDAGERIKNYIENLSKYMKISYLDESNDDTKYMNMVKNYDSEEYGIQGSDIVTSLISVISKQYLAITRDNVMYGIGVGVAAQNRNDPAYKQRLGTVLIDINAKAEPNRVGRDVFIFTLWADGSLRPYGSNDSTGTDTFNEQYNWKTGTKDKCNETTVTTGWTCAGSIFENNLKVIYQ